MTKVPGGLWQNLIAVQVYGANTGVGKTVASTLLGAHFARRSTKQRTWNIRYLKPVSTGPQEDRDDRYVTRYGGPSKATTLFQFADPVSPHVAARGLKNAPSDDSIIQLLYDKLSSDALALSNRPRDAGLSIVETAGGVLSPGPSGTPQADIYRPMRLPVILVGDHRLGGIASTISSAESLLIRGYDIDAVICFNDHSKYENAEYLQKYFDKLGISTFELPWIPDLSGTSEEREAEQMKTYYETASGTEGAYKLADRLEDRHTERLTNIGNMASRTQDVIWHPFTQHKHVEKAEDILVFDSAYGDYFQAKYTSKSLPESKELVDTPHLYPAFDGSASWWTQGLGHGNPQLSLAAAYAAGRYGHIMFAGATHEPALTLAERLLHNLENPRLSKVFYTDDGSTALEVGIKMGLRAACKRYDWDGSTENVGILGIKGSYHGDTIGAMDASEPCVYNKKVDWYRGRGYWFDFPTVKMKAGRWIVEPPAGMEKELGPAKDFEDLAQVFDNETRAHSSHYEAYITRILDDLTKKQGLKFGALVMEPIILGAGGMIFVDPLFQRTLINVVRSYDFSASPNPAPNDANTWTGLPVVFDEVFTGLYRLGRFSAASFLQLHPDISCHAKLLTGGLLPLSVTIASDSIFQAFWGDEKSDALLHGHSYTAHPIGCHVANKSLVEMKTLTASHDWNMYRESWSGERQPIQSSKHDAQNEGGNEEKTWSMWTKNTVISLSHHPRVDSVIALGSVLAITLKDTSGSGYTSTAALSLRDALLNDSNGEVRVHSRVLGNVLYLMASMTSKPLHLAGVEREVLAKLDRVEG